MFLFVVVTVYHEQITVELGNFESDEKGRFIAAVHGSLAVSKEIEMTE